MPSWDRRIESFRDRLANDLPGTRHVIERELTENSEVMQSPTLQVRLLSLLVACCRDLGKIDEGLAILERARSLGGSPVARAELATHAALLHLVRGHGAAAGEAVHEALELVDAELAKPVGTSAFSRRRRQWFTNHKAACLVIRGEIAFRLGERPLKDAMADALSALALATHRTAYRARIGAVTLLTYLLTRFGTLDDVSQALQLLDAADRDLARRRVTRKHDHRVRLRWGKALALARLGMVDRAEEILREVIRALIAADAVTAAREAVESMAWLIRERAGKPERAVTVRQRWLARLPAE